MIDQARALLDLRTLAHKHQNDRDGGIGLVDEVVRQLKRPEGGYLSRILLTLASSDSDELWGLAVEALVRGCPDTADALELYLRELRGTVAWRGELTLALARLERRSALDLILDYVDRHLGDRRSRAAQTLGYVGRFEPTEFGPRAARYFTERLKNDEPQGLVNSYVAILGDRPDALLDLIRRLASGDPSMGKRLVAMIEARLRQPYPVPGDLEALRSQLAKV